jgi:hypothetical protein
MGPNSLSSRIRKIELDHFKRSLNYHIHPANLDMVARLHGCQLSFAVESTM